MPGVDLPTPVDFYLARANHPEVRPLRPWNQGDIFVDIPLSLGPKYSTGETLDESDNVRLSMAALLGHPCSLRAGADGRPVSNQVVAEVRLASDVGSTERPFEPPYDGYYYLFPLPGLINGRDYVIDFRRPSVTHARFLQGNRIACLSRHGWAALQRRYIYHFSRGDTDHDEIFQGLAAPWHELEIWEEWTTRTGSPDGFQVWLDQPIDQQRHFGGTIRREGLSYAFDDVRADLPGS